MENKDVHAIEEQHHDVGSHTSAIWRTFWILLIITVVEVGLAFLNLYTGFPPKLMLNGVFLVLTFAKAFYIVAEFMHLKYEVKNLIMTIVIPLLLFVWFIIAFLWDGESWKTLKNTYNGTEEVKIEAHH